jgi:hypothetical protein
VDSAGNLSVISGAKRRDSEARIVHPCNRLSEDAYRQVKGRLDLAVRTSARINSSRPCENSA